MLRAEMSVMTALEEALINTLSVQIAKLFFMQAYDVGNNVFHVTF